MNKHGDAYTSELLWQVMELKAIIKRQNAELVLLAKLASNDPEPAESIEAKAVRDRILGRGTKSRASRDITKGGGL